MSEKLFGAQRSQTLRYKMFKIESWATRKVNFEPELTKDTQGVVIYTANVKAKQGKALINIVA